MYYVGL